MQMLTLGPYLIIAVDVLLECLLYGKHSHRVALYPGLSSVRPTQEVRETNMGAINHTE